METIEVICMAMAIVFSGYLVYANIRHHKKNRREE